MVDNKLFSSSASSLQPWLVSEELGEASPNTGLNTRLCGAQTWRCVTDKPAAKHGEPFTDKPSLKTPPFAPQDNSQAQMEERLMMQQQQMEDDQRWLEQEESFMVHRESSTHLA